MLFFHYNGIATTNNDNYGIRFNTVIALFSCKIVVLLKKWDVRNLSICYDIFKAYILRTPGGT